MTFTRILRLPLSSFFLLGVRGVGKTTWIQEQLPQALRINLLHEQLYQDYLREPALFAKQLGTAPPKTWVIIDEVQRLPQLLNDVHAAMEDRKLRFALLGSSARKLRRQGVNLLGGRALQRFMYPLTPYEIGAGFDLSQALTYGTIPLVYDAPSPRDQLAAYVQLYLREEIQAEALVRNLSGFARFFPIAALFHGQVMNAQGLGRDAGLGRTTVQGYLSILEDTLLAFQLPAYEGRLRVKERKHPKFYFSDAGIVRAAKRQLGPVALEERGPLFEGFLIQLVKSAREYGLIEFDEMYYWSAGRNGPEVDLVIKRGKELCGIELKAATRLRSEHFSGLRAFSAMRGLKRTLLVYEGDRHFIQDTRIEVLPVQRFFEALQAGDIF